MGNTDAAAKGKLTKTQTGESGRRRRDYIGAGATVIGGGSGVAMSLATFGVGTSSVGWTFGIAPDADPEVGGVGPGGGAAGEDRFSLRRSNATIG
jgi:hypothetical protein